VLNGLEIVATGAESQDFILGVYVLQVILVLIRYAVAWR